MCKVLATGQSVGCKAKTGATMSGFDNSGVRINFMRTSINPGANPLPCLVGATMSGEEQSAFVGGRNIWDSYC